MPCTAGVSGNVPEEKGIKNAGSPVDCPQDKWLPKPLPVCFRFVIGNESDSAALLLLLGLAQKLGQCLIDVVKLRIGAGFQFLDTFQQFFIPCDHLTHKDKCPHDGNVHLDGCLAAQVMEMFTSMAVWLRKTDESMATPCSVKAIGKVAPKL